MRQWHREVLPLSPAQCCAVCGSQAWDWVYPLRAQHAAGVTCGHFWCLCETCHNAVQQSDESELASRRGPDDGDEPYPFMAVQWPLFLASRIGGPIRRDAALTTQ